MNKFIQIIVIIMIVGFIIYKALPFLRRLKGAFKKIHFNENANLPLERYRALALGAIYSEQQSAYINSLTTGVPVSEIKSMLNNWWKVSDEQTAIETLDFLMDNVMSPFFTVMIEAYKNHNDAVILEKIPNEEKRDKAWSQAQNLEATLEAMKIENIVQDIADVERLGTDGWELGRLVYVARMCYDAGFITEQTAWIYINEANRLAKERFRNWKDFGYSYALGRSLWSGQDDANIGITYIAKYLLTEPKSPWVKMSW